MMVACNAACYHPRYGRTMSRKFTATLGGFERITDPFLIDREVRPNQRTIEPTKANGCAQDTAVAALANMDRP